MARNIDYIVTNNVTTRGSFLEDRAMAESRSWVRSSFIGIVVGVLAGGLTVFLIEALGHAVFGTGDPTDLTAITTPMWASVLVAWILGSAVGGAVATYWGRSPTARAGGIVGVVLLAGAVANMFAFPHPVWMVVGAVVLMPLAALGAARGVASTEEA
jgi:hypothetical protein